MSQTEIARIKELLDEARLRLRDLTRELDESMRAENEEQVLNELQRARDRVIALEHSLALLDSNGQEPNAGN